VEKGKPAVAQVLILVKDDQTSKDLIVANLQVRMGDVILANHQVG